MFSLAIDGKLRGCDLVRLRVGDVVLRGTVRLRRCEADFRFALTRLREHVEAVALAGGEAAERRLLSRRFGAIAQNWRGLANRELILGCFTRPYFQTVLRIPLFLALPAFLAGRVTFGKPAPASPRHGSQRPPLATQHQAHDARRA